MEGIRSFLHHRPPIAPRLPTVTFYVHPRLRTSVHVFVRHDAVQRPLSPPYDHPNKVFKRTKTTYTFDRDNKEEVVSIDHLKPAYVEDQLDKSLTVSPNTRCNLLITQLLPKAPTPYASKNPTPILRRSEANSRLSHTVTRSGHRVHFPKWLRD